MADDVKIAIVGTGAIGRLTRDALAEVPGARVVSLLSPREPYSLSPEVDLVAVCSPQGLHTQHASAAVAAGKHVVVEKPVTLTVSDGEALLAEAEAAGVTVAVISQRRWEPVVRAAKAAVDSGALGKPLLGECVMHWYRDPAYYRETAWRGTTDLDGGVLFNQGIHVIDLLRWLLGPVAGVDGGLETRVHAIDAPDTAAAVLHFRSGALGLVAATTAAHTPQPAHLNLWFEKGTIRLDDDQLVEWSVPGLPAPQPSGGVGSGSAHPAAIGVIGHRRQWASIIAAIRDGRQPEVTGRDGLGTAALVAAIHEASATGTRVIPAVP